MEFNAGVSDIDVVDDLEDGLDGSNHSIVDPIDQAQGESNHVDDSCDADDWVRQDVEQQSDSDDDFVFEGFHAGGSLTTLFCVTSRRFLWMAAQRLFTLLRPAHTTTFRYFGRKSCGHTSLKRRTGECFVYKV